MTPSFRTLTAGSVKSGDAAGVTEHVARRQRIGLFGLMGVGNFGNDASLEAVLAFLRTSRPAADIVCICGNPDKVSATFDVDAMPINWRPKSAVGARINRWLLNIPREAICFAKALRRCWTLDVLVIPGTGILDDFSTGPRGMPYWLFRWCTLARLCGTKLLFVSIGAGPIDHPLSRWLMRTAVEQADFRSYRDAVSRDYMAGLGTDVSADAVYPDVVFALPHEKPPMPSKEATGPIVVGIGVMSYNGWRGDTARDTSIYDAYMDTLEAFAGWLLAQGHRLRIFMGDDGDGDAIDDLARRLQGTGKAGDMGAVHVAHVRSLRDVCDEIADCDAVVATRFHNVVAALALGRPILSIGYAKKNDVLLAEARMGELCQHIEHLDLQRLKNQFRLMLDRRDELSADARRMSDGFAERLREQNERLLTAYL